MPDLTLFLDTTTSRLMLALGNRDGLFASRQIPCDSHRYHSALMIPAIEEMLQENQLTVKDLSALAVNTGPGSFTGIRTGLITARTMGQFLNLPIHAFNMFELLAADTEIPLAIYLDALRGRAYYATLSWNAAGPTYWRQPPGLVRLNEEAPEPPPQARLLVSPGLTTYFPKSRLKVIDEHFFTPAAMALLMQKYPMRFQLPWQKVEPLYLQEPSITLKGSQASG